MLGLLHGAQGCSTFIRLQLSRHFKESIALNSTAMSEDWPSSVAGKPQERYRAGHRKFQPEVVGVMTSGSPKPWVTTWRAPSPTSVSKTPRSPRPRGLGLDARLLWLFQEGYAAAVESLLARPAPRVAAHHRPGDSPPRRAPHPRRGGGTEGLVAAFGLDVLTVPDISNALDGHIDEEVSPLSTGGMPVEDIRRAGRSIATLVRGRLPRPRGRAGWRKAWYPGLRIPSLTGSAEVDASSWRSQRPGSPGTRETAARRAGAAPGRHGGQPLPVR